MRTLTARPTAIQDLKKASILNGVSEESLEQLAEHGEFKTYKSGDTIMQEGENSDTMYIFLEGEVEVSKNLTLKLSGKGFGQVEKSMTKLKASTASVFGEMSLFQTEPRSATVSATADCLLFEISRDAFRRFCGQDPRSGIAILEKIASILSSRLRKSNEDVLKDRKSVV